MESVSDATLARCQRCNDFHQDLQPPRSKPWLIRIILKIMSDIRMSSRSHLGTMQVFGLRAGAFWRRRMDIERFVRRENVKHYRHLLESVSDKIKRNTIIKLLSEEVQKQKDTG